MFEFHREDDGSLTLSSAVHQALGAASTCWSESGVFQPEQALDIGDKLIQFIEQREA